VSACIRREPAIDFLSARGANLAGLSDLQVLSIAAEKQRVLVTHDFRTLPKYFAIFLEQNRFSPGVFLVKQRLPIALVIDELLLMWNSCEACEWENSIVEIPV
jgi:hypothetical protein